MTDFFQPGRAYLHHGEDGQPSGEGLFLVEFVGRAPEPFEHHSETLGVAFGWRQGPAGPSGDWDALGSYTTPDFAGWREVDLPDTTTATPDGCCAHPESDHQAITAGEGTPMLCWACQAAAWHPYGAEPGGTPEPGDVVEVVTARWGGEEPWIDEDGTVGVPLTVEGRPVVLSLSDDRAVDLAAELTDCHEANNADGYPTLTKES